MAKIKKVSKEKIGEAGKYDFIKTTYEQVGPGKPGVKVVKLPPVKVSKK